MAPWQPQHTSVSISHHAMSHPIGRLARSPKRRGAVLCLRWLRLSQRSERTRREPSRPPRRPSPEAGCPSVGWVGLVDRLASRSSAVDPNRTGCPVDATRRRLWFPEAHPPLPLAVSVRSLASACAVAAGRCMFSSLWGERQQHRSETWDILGRVRSSQVSLVAYNTESEPRLTSSDQSTGSRCLQWA